MKHHVFFKFERFNHYFKTYNMTKQFLNGFNLDPSKHQHHEMVEPLKQFVGNFRQIV